MLPRFPPRLLLCASIDFRETITELQTDNSKQGTKDSSSRSDRLQRGRVCEYFTRPFYLSFSSCIVRSFLLSFIHDTVRWSRVTWGCLTGWYLMREIIMCVWKMSGQEISSKESQMLKSDSLSIQQQTRLDIPLTLPSRLFTCFSMAAKHLAIQLRIFCYIGIVFSRFQLLKHNLLKLKKFRQASTSKWFHSGEDRRINEMKSKDRCPCALEYVCFRVPASWGLASVNVWSCVCMW